MATSPVNTASVAEGDKLIAEAEKCLKTTWFKWNADLDSAAHAFDKAGLSYRNAKAYDKARDAYERASDVYYKNHALFHSGKALEQAANMCRDMNALEQSADYLERASGRYHESGHGDTAGQVLTKAARLVETVSPLKSAQYYLSTADLHEVEEMYRDAATATRYAVNMYARSRDLDKLLGALYKLKNLYEITNQYRHLYEVAAIEVAVHLHQGDLSAATDSFNTAATMHGFPSSDAAPLLEKLLQSYRERDEEVFHKCCDDVLFRTMDNEVAKLARDLKTKLQFDGFDSPSHSSGLMTGVTPVVTGGLIGGSPLLPSSDSQSPGNDDQTLESSEDKYSGIN